MEALMQQFQAAGFSEAVSRLTAAPTRSSTIACMMTGDFASLAGQQGGPTAAQVAAFLFSLFRTHGLSLQMVMGYRVCLASVLSHTQDSSGAG